MAPSSMAVRQFIMWGLLQQAFGLTANVTTVSGYLVDVNCYRRAVAGSLAPDGTDVIKRPWTHTLHCLRDPPRCYENGYYVAVNMGPTLAGPGVGDGDYRPKFTLDVASSEMALRCLRTYPVGHARDNVEGHLLVTVVGTVNDKGVMSATSMEECSGAGCDGTCVGDCGAPSSGDESLQVPALLWLHVVCMILSWGCLLPLGVVFAMNLRRSDAKVVGMPIWFFGHRTLQTAGWALQLVGFAAILAHKTGVKHFAAPHEIIGLIVVIVGSLRTLNAQLRHLPFVGHASPEGERSLGRNVGEVMHKGLGYLAVFGGVFNVCLGIYYAWSLKFDGGLFSFAIASLSIIFLSCMAFAVFARMRLNKSSNFKVGAT